MLLMQHVPYHYFNNLVQDHTFQLVKAVMKDTSTTTAILLVFLLDDQLTSIKHLHIRLVVCCTSCQFYESKSILWFIKLIKTDLKQAPEK